MQTDSCGSCGFYGCPHQFLFQATTAWLPTPRLCCVASLQNGLDGLASAKGEVTSVAECLPRIISDAHMRGGISIHTFNVHLPHLCSTSQFIKGTDTMFVSAVELFNIMQRGIWT